MTAQGSAYMQFKRALAGKNFDAAWMLALELPPLPLVDALALLLLARDADPERFVRGAVRVHARLCSEANLSLEEAQLVLAALDAMRASSCPSPGPNHGVKLALSASRKFSANWRWRSVGVACAADSALTCSAMRCSRAPSWPRPTDP